MAIYTTEVLVLGVKNWGNADKIVTLLSPTYGKQQKQHMVVDVLKVH